MLDTLRTLLHAAAGVLDLTDERLSGIVDDLVRRGQLAVDDARELRAEWARRAGERRPVTEERVRALVDEALALHNVAGYEDVAALEQRVRGVELTVARMASTVTEHGAPAPDSPR